MGDSHADPLRVDFDRTIKREFHGSTVTNYAGLLAYREFDDALKLTSTAASGLPATRPGSHTSNRPTDLAPRPAEIAATVAEAPRTSRLQM